SLLLRLQKGPAREVALGLVQRDDPAQARLDQAGRLVHVVPVKAHPGLEAQGVTRAQAGRLHALLAAGLDEAPPERLRVVGGDEDLEPVLAGVSRARNRCAM